MLNTLIWSWSLLFGLPAPFAANLYMAWLPLPLPWSSFLRATEMLSPGLWVLNILSTTNWHLPRAPASDWTTEFAICLCGDWTLCCLAIKIKHPEAIQDGVRHSVLQGIWWNRSLNSKVRARLHWSPLHQNLTYQPSPTTSLEQSLKAIWGAVSQFAVLILSQVKLNLQLSSCASFCTHCHCIWTSSLQSYLLKTVFRHSLKMLRFS